MSDYAEMAAALQEFSDDPCCDMPNLVRKAAGVIEGLSEHEVEGGISMDCGHPVQALCALPNGKGRCRWCEELRTLKGEI